MGIKGLIEDSEVKLIITTPRSYYYILLLPYILVEKTLFIYFFFYLNNKKLYWSSLPYSTHFQSYRFANVQSLLDMVLLRELFPV